MGCHVILCALTAHADHLSGSLGITLYVTTRHEVADIIALGVIGRFEYPIGRIACAAFASYAVVAFHIVNHKSWRAREVANGISMIFQGPVSRGWVIVVIAWVIRCWIEGVITNLTNLFGREKALEEPGIIDIALEVALARLVSSDAETAGTGLESPCRNGTVALSIYEICKALADWIAHDSDMLPSAWFERTRGCMVLTAAQKTVIEK